MLIRPLSPFCPQATPLSTPLPLLQRSGHGARHLTLRHDEQESFVGRPLLAVAPHECRHLVIYLTLQRGKWYAFGIRLTDDLLRFNVSLARTGERMPKQIDTFQTIC